MTQTFFIATPNHAAAATATGLPCALLCYRIRQGGVLQSTALPRTTRGGLLGILFVENLDSTSLPRLQQQILAECHRRGYIGVLFCSPPSLQSLQPLCTALQAQDLTVFLPPESAAQVPHSIVLLPGSLSGGTFGQMVGDYTAQVPPNRIALQMQRCRHWFSMPSTSPDGTPLPVDWLPPQQMFYSPELCTNYCLAPKPDNKLEFLLLDDVTSITRRIQAAANHGIPYTMLSYDEWQSDASALAQMLTQTKE